MALTFEPDPDRSCRLLISIINFRTAEMTKSCVMSVLDDLDGDSRGVDAQVVVVDNGSGDGSDRVLGDWISEAGIADRVRLVLSPDNTGFSGGHNLGLVQASAEYYLVLNSDALLRPGFCRSILDHGDKTPEAGLIAPYLEYEDGTCQVSCFRAHGFWSELDRGAQTGVITRLLRRHLVPLTMPPEPDQIEWASFAAILIRRAVLDQVGLMDEGYFLYFEDTEYSLRTRDAGWRVLYAPDARALHYQGGSGPAEALAAAFKRRPAYHYASRTRLFYQRKGRVGLFMCNLAWHLGRFIGWVRGKPVVDREWRDIWINFWTPLGDRRAPGGDRS